MTRTSEPGPRFVPWIVQWADRHDGVSGVLWFESSERPARWAAANLRDIRGGRLEDYIIGEPVQVPQWAAPSSLPTYEQDDEYVEFDVVYKGSRI